MAHSPVLGGTCELQFVMSEATMFARTCLLILQNVFEKDVSCRRLVVLLNSKEMKGVPEARAEGWPEIYW